MFVPVVDRNNKPLMIMDTLVTSECKSLNEQISRVMRETPAYQLPDGEVVYLRDELWIKPLIEVNECEFTRNMFGLVWQPEYPEDYVELEGVYLPCDYVEDMQSGWAADAITLSGDQVSRSDAEWIPLPMAAWATIMDRRAIESNNDFWTPAGYPSVDISPDNIFIEAVCPICGKAECDHYDNYEPMFKSCPTI